jgi:hypothetical protein
VLGSAGSAGQKEIRQEDKQTTQKDDGYMEKGMDICKLMGTAEREKS